MNPPRVLLLFFWTLFTFVCSAAPNVTVSPPETGGLLEAAGEAKAGQQTLVEKSMNLVDWWPAYLPEPGAWSWQDALESGSTGQFYRVRAADRPVIAPDDSWTSNLALPETAGESGSPFLICSNGVCSAKFIIFVDDLSRVYFQDSDTYDFHYEFAVDKLGPFLGMDRDAFDAATLRRAGQVAFSGAVLLDPLRKEFGIRFEGLDAYPKELVAFLYRLVEASLERDESYRGFYMPGLHQESVSRLHFGWFAENGIEIADLGRWLSEAGCYSNGWALGRLRFVQADAIDDAYESGELTSEDILLTDGVPAEIPYLAGVVTLQPATPNSHVALLAQSYGVPYFFVSDEQIVEQLISLEGSEVLVAASGIYDCSIKVVDAEGALDEESRAALLALKTVSPIQLAPRDPYGAISADVAGLTPDDIDSFGGKASNFGFLLREIPERTRPFAVAFSFDLWDAYLDQQIEPGVTLRAWIESKLSGYAWPVEDVASLKADLKDVRDRIEDEADFDAAQRAEILEALGAFDPDRKIRFRSSSNVEDGEQFSGAGLYESKSGCLADELDGDTSGPSQCDPEDDNEDGVFRAMRQVYASFFNVNAYLERRRFQVDEGRAAMGILAHYSYPDEIEMANGVIVLEGGASPKMEIVSQPGAESVTNPDPSAVPEVAQVYGRSRTVSFSQRAALLPDGRESVLEETDYIELYDLCVKVADAYKAFHGLPSSTRFTLDFEYKKVAPGVLEIKQVRRLPIAELDRSPRAFVGDSADFEILAGGGFHAMPYHYLKSVLHVNFAAERWPDLHATGKPLIKSISLERQRGGELVTWTGDPLELPGASYASEDGVGYYRWSEQWEGEMAEFELTHWFGGSEGFARGPFVIGSDTQLSLSVDFENPRFADFDEPTPYLPADIGPVYADRFTAGFRPKTTSEQFGSAWRLRIESGEPSPDGVEIVTEFTRDPPPSNFTVGYTWTMVSWVKTEIRGLASETVTLRSPFSQTQVQSHHNFSSAYVFEPQLDDGVPLSVKQELASANVRLIYWLPDNMLGLAPGIWYVGFDGVARDRL